MSKKVNRKYFFNLVNGQLKQWKYFSQTIQNSSLRFLSNYIDITCALINAYGPRYIKDIHFGAEMAHDMLDKCQKPNPVQMRLVELTKEKMHWKKYDAQLLLFPELTEEDVRNLCFGNEIVLYFLNRHLNICFRKLSNQTSEILYSRTSQTIIDNR